MHWIKKLFERRPPAPAPSREYLGGFLACLNRVPINENPYFHGSWEADEWSRGWDRGDEWLAVAW